jgi:hypothetical protein
LVLSFVEKHSGLKVLMPNAILVPGLFLLIIRRLFLAAASQTRFVQQTALLDAELC